MEILQIIFKVLDVLKDVAVIILLIHLKKDQGEQKRIAEQKRVQIAKSGPIHHWKKD